MAVTIIEKTDTFECIEMKNSSYSEATMIEKVQFANQEKANCICITNIFYEGFIGENMKHSLNL